MHGLEFELDDDEPAPVSQEPVIDFEVDPIDIREVNENGPPFTFGEPDWRIANADLDNALDEFVDLVNARDLDGLTELLASDVEADFLGEFSRDGVIAVFNDLFLRCPSLLVTRGDLGSRPMVAVWIFDREDDRFDPLGYIPSSWASRRKTSCAGSITPKSFPIRRTWLWRPRNVPSSPSGKIGLNSTRTELLLETSGAL